MNRIKRVFTVSTKLNRQNVIISLLLLLLMVVVYLSYVFSQIDVNNCTQGSALRKHWMLTQRDRLLKIENVCSAHNQTDKSYAEVLKNKKLLRFLVYSDEHRVISCNIPKIASTNWRRVFAVLNGFFDAATDPKDVPLTFVHNRRDPKLVLLDLTPEEQLQRLQTYKQFLFVRHPFERLVSAYKDKLRGNSTDSVEHFQKTHGAKMLRFVRPSEKENIIKRGGDLHFEEFVRYLVESPDPIRMDEPHWRLMTRICEPCLMNYSFVGKYDTMLLDVYMILAELGIDPPFLFPSKDDPQSRTGNELLSYMKNVSREHVSKLYEAYKNDFQTFGYDYAL